MYEIKILNSTVLLSSCLFAPNSASFSMFSKLLMSSLDILFSFHKSRLFHGVLAQPVKRGLVDSQFISLLKMTYRCWALREHCFYRCQTCSLFLRVCLRGNSAANRRDPCHHHPCFLPCLILLSYVGLEEDSISSSLKETTKGEPCSEDRLQHNR